MHEFKLKNGIDLCHIKSKNAKTTCVSVLVRNKLNRETATKFALLPHILSRGTQYHKNIKEINAKLNAAYGAAFQINIIKKGSEQILNFFAECLNGEELVSDIISLLEEAVFLPLNDGSEFAQSYFEAAKTVLSKNILSLKNDKTRYAQERCLEEMFKEEDPFGISADGYLDDISLIKNSELFDLYIKSIKREPVSQKMLEETNRVEAC